MGNSQVDQKKQSLRDYQLPVNYFENCHPNLLDLNIDKKQVYLLSGYILSNLDTQKWLANLAQLSKSKYILTPCRVIDKNDYQKPTCNPQHNQQIGKIKIAYQPFVYSLNSEINTRKRFGKYFTQNQLWKLIKYLTKALIQWHSQRPFEKILSIMPENIIFNFKGNMRLVTQYSFPKHSYHQKPRPIYLVPEDRISSIIKYQQPNKFRILSDDLYSIGMTILDCMILEGIQQSNIMFSTLKDKLNYMNEHCQIKYTTQLLQIIETLLQQDYKKRPNPHDLVQLAKNCQDIDKNL